jgi:2-dehydro-3-deoxyphosphogluconate aldolase/(4S)-4-hydroxy-2-oxoglutarate aldolase
MNETLRRIGRHGIVPVISLPDAQCAEPLARALVAGGLPVAEVTFRSAAAAEGIARMKKAEPDMLVGAGTVITVDNAEAALDAGAAFIVAPGFDPAIVDICLSCSVPVMPGVATASELTQAVVRQLPAVKFFPAEAMGGLKTLKALSAPFPNVLFMPTGGVDASNMASYLAWDRILAVGGSWMVAKHLLAAGHYDDICDLTARAVAVVQGLKRPDF